MQDSLVDRFGETPPQAKALLESHRLRVLGKPLGVARLDASSETLQLQFVPDPPLDAGKVIKMVQANRGWRLSGPSKLRIERVTGDLAERVRAVKQTLDTLRGAANA